MRFAGRLDAAGLLTRVLQARRGRLPLVAALARGAQPMGRVAAERLQGELAVVLVRRLRSLPTECAIGAIACLAPVEAGQSAPAPP